MAKEAKVRVRLDTKQAKGELRGLTRLAASTAGRVGAGVRAAAGRSVGLVTAGAGIGAGIGAVKAATSSGIGDIAGETFGLIGAQLTHAILGSLPEEARAARNAREETIQAFGAIAGRTNRIPPGASNFFAQVRSLRQDEERGRRIFETAEGFRGPGVEKLIDRLLEGFGKLLSEAVSGLADRLNIFSGK